MTADNLPAVRTSAAAATRPQPTGQSARQQQLTPALRLSTALLLVSAVAALLAGVSAYAGRAVQSVACLAAVLALLFAAGVERYRERTP